MQTSHVVISILLITGYKLFGQTEALIEGNLQRGGKSIFWVWSNMLGSSADTQRRRRFLSDDNPDPWWKEMQPNSDLSPSEEIYFSGLRHPESLEEMEEDSDKKEMLTTTTEHTPQPHDVIDSALLRERIIEEHHRPSKTELESAFQRLRESRSSSMNETSAGSSEAISPTIELMTEPPSSLEDPSPELEKPMSAVEYVVPGVEHVLPQVEYLHPFEAFRQPEKLLVEPKVEYVEPSVEFVESEIPYFKEENVSEFTTYSVEDESVMEMAEEVGRLEPPEEEIVTIGQNRILRVKNENHLRMLKNENRRIGKSRRVHRRHPGEGIPDIDYPTLEILPVVHFPCEEYGSPGYYADTVSRCQMFHICHEDGQRTSFLCPVGTVFNQEYLVCDWWYNVDCENSLQYFISDSVGAFVTKDQKSDNVDNLARISVYNNNLNYSEPSRYFEETYFVSKDNPDLNQKLSQDRAPYQPQRTNNYPMGYAILLREAMKSSTKQPDVEDITENTNTRALGGSVEEKVQTDYSNNGREFTYYESNKLKNVKQSTEFNEQQTHYRYFGGSKPFVESLQNKLFKKIKSKRVRIKYLSPENTSTAKPTMKEAVSFSWNVRNTLNSPSGSLAEKKEPSRSNDRRLSNTGLWNNVRARTPFVPELYLNSNNEGQSFQRSINQDYEVVYPLYPQRSDKANLNTQSNEYLSAESIVQYKKDNYTKNNNVALPRKYAFGINKTRTFESKTIEKYENTTQESSFTGEYEHNRKQYQSEYHMRETKPYILNPDDYLMGSGINKKFGDRLCKAPCQNTKKSDTVSETEINLQKAKKAKDVFETQSKQTKVSLSETTSENPFHFLTENSLIQHEVTTRPLELVTVLNETKMNKPDRFNYILGRSAMRRPTETETTTYPQPVYIPSAKPKLRKSQLKTNETSGKVAVNQTQNSEFHSTSSFIKRISNLLSVIKAPENGSETKNRSIYGTSFTTSVRVVGKDILNGTKATTTSHFKPWNIEDHYSPIPPKTYNDTFNQKLKHEIEIIRVNSTRNNNAHGGYVVIKKVRLK